MKGKIPPQGDWHGNRIGSGAQGLARLATADLELMRRFGLAEHRTQWMRIPRQDLDTMLEPFFTTMEIGPGTGRGLPPSGGDVGAELQ